MTPSRTNPLRRASNFLRGTLQKYGGSTIKRKLWNAEFSRGDWNCLDSTVGNNVYPRVERYLKGGSILDLGCGAGATAAELTEGAFKSYTGVDISDVALDAARRKIEVSAGKRDIHYVQSDIISYLPDRTYDVILFRDSIYYVARERLTTTLRRYAGHLTPEGVLIARVFDIRGKCRFFIDTIENHFKVVEKHIDDDHSCVVIFRLRDVSDFR